MDFILDIIILKSEVEKVKLHERLIGWGDDIYQYDPPRYSTDSNIIFEQVNNLGYFEKEVGEVFNNDMIALTLKGNFLLELQYAINNTKLTLKENKLALFLCSLFNLNCFYILLMREDERVKRKYEIKEKEEIFAKLYESLNWSNPQDVLLVKRNMQH